MSEPNLSHSFGGESVERVENEKIRYTDKFEDPNLPGETETTVVITRVGCIRPRLTLRKPMWRGYLL